MFTTGAARRIGSCDDGRVEARAVERSAKKLRARARACACVRVSAHCQLGEIGTLGGCCGCDFGSSGRVEKAHSASKKAVHIAAIAQLTSTTRSDTDSSPNAPSLYGRIGEKEIGWHRAQATNTCHERKNVPSYSR